MKNGLIHSYVGFLDGLATRKPLFLFVALSRTFLAIGTLITLVLSGPSILFDEPTFGKLSFNPTLEYFNIFTYFGFAHITVYYAVCIAVLLAVVSGFYPRLTGVLHWLVSFSLFRSAQILEGGDQITVIITLLLIPVTLVDARPNHWQLGREYALGRANYFVANVSWAVIQLQMGVLYLQASVEKVYKLEEWKNGTAIYYFLNDPIFGYPAWMERLLASALTNAYVVSGLTWGTILFEIILAGAIFMRPKNRAKLLLPAVGFHLFIALAFGLVSFFFAMAGGLLVFLATKKTEAKLAQTLRRLVQRSGSTPAAVSPHMVAA
ncbi:sporulation-delaying protein SdpB family protein [Hymenobacter chitinivorans]|uniref:Antimicrobial peptide system SdpB family protein n=1 Tax=Hymenobacter chitinivorans DSM 11115 TaxID=1121954 RepID=A0A2M9BSY3_9BACT|nr:sporulation-delaying protein SdpB family protein [Hymenobacter chitinivorans]PJJ61043.1 antimicrobial peptide system SdpB family protein [Hymenobacter chitinivorans DSM 11115]